MTNFNQKKILALYQKLSEEMYVHLLNQSKT